MGLFNMQNSDFDNNRLNGLPVGNIFYLSFCSSVWICDLINRFGVGYSFYNKIITRGLKNLLVEFNFKLPSGNNFSKFRNRVHFILYYLFFELVVGQRPRVVVNKTGTSLSKNKREVKKAQLFSTVDSFKFVASLATFSQIMVFLNFIIFLISPLTNKGRVAPSRHVLVTLEPSKTAVTGWVKNLSLLGFPGLVDDLGGSAVGFKFRLIPFSGGLFSQNLDYKPMLLYFANSLGLVVENDAGDGQNAAVLNLRKRSFFVL